MSDTDTQHPFTISHLQRREIQAPIAASLIRSFANTLGYDKALDIAAAAIRADAMAAGRSLSAQGKDHPLLALGQVVREVWAAGEALTVCMLKETDQELSFDVTRCQYAELYERLGMQDLGYCLSCNRDEAFADGFYPGLKLVRTQTIMQGAPRCDFRFYLENPCQPDSADSGLAWPGQTRGMAEEKAGS